MRRSEQSGIRKGYGCLRVKLRQAGQRTVLQPQTKVAGKASGLPRKQRRINGEQTLKYPTRRWRVTL